MSFEHYDSLSGEAKVRYDKKLDIIGIKECPFKLAADMWTNDQLNGLSCNSLISALI